LRAVCSAHEIWLSQGKAYLSSERGSSSIPAASHQARRNERNADKGLHFFGDHEDYDKVNAETV